MHRSTVMVNNPYQTRVWVFSFEHLPIIISALPCHPKSCSLLAIFYRTSNSLVPSQSLHKTLLICCSRILSLIFGLQFNMTMYNSLYCLALNDSSGFHLKKTEVGKYLDILGCKYLPNSLLYWYAVEFDFWSCVVKQHNTTLNFATI